MPDVEINGVAYRLAEDAEGEHYSLSAEPLRPPNAVTVQGEDSQKFQMRPDTLLWSLTDWSGGEGQQKFDPENSNRWRELTYVRVFDEPGTLRPGWGTREVKDGGVAIDANGPLIQHKGTLYLFDDSSPKTYKFTEWSNEWQAPVTLTGPTNGASRIMAADHENMYWHETGTVRVWKWSGSGSTAVRIDDGTLPVTPTDACVQELGPYVYLYSPSSGRVWEMPKTGTPNNVVIDDFTDDPGAQVVSRSAMVVMGGKIYTVANKISYTAIREITPTTAAGAGFGAEIARFPGFSAQALWSHGGVLYSVGLLAGSKDTAILYLDPGGAYGSLGTVRAHRSTTISATPQNADLLNHYIVFYSDLVMKILEIDAVTGNMAQLAEYNENLTVGQGMLFKDNGFFWTTTSFTSGYKKPYQADPAFFMPSSSVVSPWNDFALADEKILSSLVLSMEELPVDWRIRVDYAINGEDTWVNVIDNTTENSTGGKTFVSTDSSTVKFRSLSLRIRMDYQGLADPPTTAPTILGVDALAMVAKPTKVWRLLLDLSDSKSRTAGVSGSRQATNLSTAADTESVVVFKDYYGSHTPGEVEEHDVIIDSYALVLSQPGEGVAAVTLKEMS